LAPVEREPDGGTGRIEGFTDGVMAIAITLIAVEIRVPQVVERPGAPTLARALAAQWPSYAAYALSFLFVGTLWANHRNRFRYIVRSDHALLFLNTLLLMFVGLVPFSTGVLAEYMLGAEAERRAAMVVYTATVAATALMFLALWAYAARGYRLVDRSLDPALLRALTRRYVMGAVLPALAFLLAFLNPVASFALLSALGVQFMLPEPSTGPGASARDGRSSRRVGG
jgi:uncharacterized membrane protein